MHLGYYALLMGFEANDAHPEYQISKEDANVIQSFQVCKAFNCLDINVYRKNPAWWNKACHALIRTENKVQQDKIEDK